MHPPFQLGGGGVKISEKSLLRGGGGVENFFWVGGFYCGGQGGGLSSNKISFSMAIWHKCLEHSVVFPVNLF